MPMYSYNFLIDIRLTLEELLKKEWKYSYILVVLIDLKVLAAQTLGGNNSINSPSNLLICHLLDCQIVDFQQNNLLLHLDLAIVTIILSL